MPYLQQWTTVLVQNSEMWVGNTHACWSHYTLNMWDRWCKHKRLCDCLKYINIWPCHGSRSYVWQQCLVSGVIRMATRLAVLKFHASVFQSISGVNMVLGNSVRMHWLTVNGENATNRLNVKISLSMFESVIWVTSEKWSTLPELEVGQSCLANTIDNNWILWPTGQIHQSLRGRWHDDEWITPMFYCHTCSLNLCDNVLACPTLVWTG